MKISLLLSSYNQEKRLFYSLQSAISQKMAEGNSIEIILADDHSTDGTYKMIEKYFPDVIVSLNDKSIKNKDTLADNWNQAAKLATGDRLIFSNGDILFASGFAEAHADPIFDGHIIFGPYERSDEKLGPYLEFLPMKIKDQIINERQFSSHKEIVKLLSENNWISRDLHHDDSIYTYNQEYSIRHPWGGNFSVMKSHFDAVGGFDGRQYYGGEEMALVEKIVTKFPSKVLSNKNAYAIHLWHPQYNKHGLNTRQEYLF